MEEAFFIWQVKPTPLRNRMVADMDWILSRMVETDDMSKAFKSMREIRIDVSLKMLDDETESIGDVLHQLMDRNGREWLRDVTFLGPLGQGSFGFVTKAWNKRNGEVTAVKLLIREEDQMERMAETEYNNIKFIYHRNLVRTHDIWEKSTGIEELKSLQPRMSSNSDFSSMLSRLAANVIENTTGNGSIKLLCLEMEFCGSTLRHWLEFGENREDGATQLLVIHQILEGLGFLHSKNIVHRDLKPENILFSPGERFPVKIADFGLARVLPDQKTLQEPPAECDCESDRGPDTPPLTTKIGTPLYTAPEVATGNYGTPADLYSMGFLMWEILCRIQPLQQRRLNFKRLKRKDTAVIDEKEANAFVSNGKELIVALTKAEVIDRIQSVENIKVITIPAVFIPKHFLELEVFLKCGGIGSRIEICRVNGHKTNLLHRNDTFCIDCSFSLEESRMINTRQKSRNGLSLKDGCLIKGTEPDDLNGYDIKLIRHNMSNVEGGGFFRLLFVHLQELNLSIESMGWASPLTLEIQERLELTGVAEFNATYESVREYGIFGGNFK